MEDGIILGYEDCLILYFHQLKKKEKFVRKGRIKSLSLKKSMGFLENSGLFYDIYVDYNNYKIVDEKN